MSSIGSIGTSSMTSLYSAASSRRQRPDASQMAEDLFSKLDTTGKGYIEQSDLTSALSSTSSSGSSTASTDTSELFSQLDSNGDGKVTQDELTTSLQKLTESLDNEFNRMRMQGGMPPPPPAGQNDTGFTQEELTNKLSEIGSSDSKTSNLMSKVLENFQAADTNQDGKVSFQEAIAYDKANPTTSTSSSGTSTTSTSSTDSGSTTVASSEKSDAQVFRQLMDLLRTYGNGSDSTTNPLGMLVTSA